MCLHVGKGRCYRVERRGCDPRKACIGNKRKKDRPLANLPGEIIGDWARRLDKLIVCDFSCVKVDDANPS